MEVVQLAPIDVPDAAGVLARAFHGDPATLYMVPEPERRDSILQPTFAMLLNHAIRNGQVWTTAGKPLAVALWLLPGQTSPSEEELAQAGMGEVMEQVGPEVLGRFSEMDEHFSKMHATLIPEPHYYLSVLGVEPSEQGKGIGGALLDSFLSTRTDAPAYLETLTPVDVRFYEKHGFRVIQESDPEGMGVHVWYMRRD